jgi:hypothetical protein
VYIISLKVQTTFFQSLCTFLLLKVLIVLYKTHVSYHKVIPRNLM